MNEFWEWMEKNNVYYDKSGDHFSNNWGHCIEAENQMLIGYMIEYCLEKKIIFIVAFVLETNIEGVYNYLEKIIIENSK